MICWSSRIQGPSGVCYTPGVARAARVSGAIDADAGNALLARIASLGGLKWQRVTNERCWHGQRKDTKLQFH
jgi:hypothetical protein